MLQAVTQGNILEVKKLLDSKGDISVKSEKGGRSLLHISAFHKNVDLAKILLEAGINVDEQDDGGNTALHLTFSPNKSLEALLITRFLIQFGANIDAQNKRNETPAHFAARHGHLQSIKYLVENKCNLNVKTCEGETALDLSRTFKNDEIFEYLIERPPTPMSYLPSQPRTPDKMTEEPPPLPHENEESDSEDIVKKTTKNLENAISQDDLKRDSRVLETATTNTSLPDYQGTYNLFNTLVREQFQDKNLKPEDELLLTELLSMDLHRNDIKNIDRGTLVEKRFAEENAELEEADDSEKPEKSSISYPAAADDYSEDESSQDETDEKEDEEPLTLEKQKSTGNVSVLTNTPSATHVVENQHNMNMLQAENASLRETIQTYEGLLNELSANI